MGEKNRTGPDGHCLSEQFALVPEGIGAGDIRGIAIYRLGQLGPFMSSVHFKNLSNRQPTKVILLNSKVGLGERSLSFYDIQYDR